jgi:hypothetical protein
MYAKLTWENNNASRSAWSEILFNLITPQLAIFASAQDIETVRPGFSTLEADQQVSVIAQLFCSDALYESSWNPASSDVDVGSASDKNSWSVGLWQMSVCDQANYGFTFGFTYEDLLEVQPNAQLAIGVMCKQIQRHGKILLDWKTERGSVYWSSLSPNNKYNHVANILKDVQALQV